MLAEQAEQALRRLFWEVIINQKTGLGEESTFEFKYIPDLSRKTQTDDALEPGAKHNGIEQRDLQALGIGCSLIALVGFFCLKILAAVIHCVARWLH